MSTQADDSAATGWPAQTWLAWSLIVLCALAAGVHAYSFFDAGPFDDDFIVHRYARNWIQGEGLVFNPGERVEGYTVPLWLFLSAAVQWLGLDAVAGSQWISIGSCALAALVVGASWRARFSEAVLPVPALLLAAAPTFAWHGVTGLGTTLLAALLCAWACSWERAARTAKGGLAADLCLALACLMRQECALFVLPYVWFEWRRGRRLAGLPALISLGGWTLFRLVYYGRLLPMTYAVKKLSFTDDLSYGLKYLLASTWECGVPLLLLAALWGFARGHLRKSRDGTSVQPALLFGLTLHLVYVVLVGGDFMPWSRFWMPTLPLLIYLACVSMRCELRAYPAMSAVLVLACAVLPQWLQLGWTEHGRPQRFGENAFFEQRWELLGHTFAERFPEDTLVAISPIGAFGFASGLPIVDILGLTQEGPAEVEPNLEITMKGHHRSDGAWVLAQEPDALILGNGVLQPPKGNLVINPWERGIVEHPSFAQKYGAVLMSIEGSGPLLFYLKRGLELPVGARWM